MSIPVPKLVEAKRISWINLVMVLGSLIGLWAILAVFSDASGSLSLIEGASGDGSRWRSYWPRCGC
jgi:hypothetical protein